MNAFSYFRMAVLLIALAAVQSAIVNTAHSLLFCGTDASAFAGMNGQLAVIQTEGASTVGKVEIYNLTVPLNGITNSGEHLLTGQPQDVGDIAGNILRTVSDTKDPKVLATFPPGDNSFSSLCCNEQMLVTPTSGIYHVHYSDSIQRISKNSGETEVVRTYPQSDVVGIATDGTTIWISKWDDRQVGTWDPTTNTFTPIFTTPSNAGALAWDTANGVLWVGMEGGSVIPYSATGEQLGNGFSPFGDLSGDTVDGLAFVAQ